MNINLKLKSRIVEHFGTQRDFAEHLRLNDSIVSNVVRNHRELDARERRRWAKALQTDERDLFGVAC